MHRAICWNIILKKDSSLPSGIYSLLGVMIRELKSETQEWIDRALRAEYDLAQRPLLKSEQLYLFANSEEE